MSQVRRRTLFLALAGALVAATTLAACGDATRVPSGPEHSAGALEAQLTKLHRESNRLLDGGPNAFKTRLAALRGAPVVVNQWASWCGPCRYEFPFFQRLAKRYGDQVAFLGVDSQDNRSAAQAFLKKFPVPYPHFYDKQGSVARVFRGGRSWPTTAFYASSGELAFTHVGSYATQAKLDEDIRRYALHG
jgi:cytochrome c biogenesis protein CcmG, thiol:disulfide interchange protein DsbE